MYYSIQTAVSDGSMAELLLSIQYPSRDSIHVFFDMEEDALGWSWAPGPEKKILFDNPVPAGVEVRVQRLTNVLEVPNVYGADSGVGYAEFNADTIDENFQQTLYVAQEIKDVSAEATDTSREALDKAEQAIETANTADGKADAATQTADTAYSIANQARDDASEAKSDAANAVTVAGQASTAASSAVTTANLANTTANTALDTAEQAEEKADDAVAAAEGAVETADEAYDVATGIEAKADAALEAVQGIGLTDEDLNDVSVPGLYIQMEGTDATTARNYPVENSPGALQVLQGGAVGVSPSNIIQEYTTNTTPPRKFVRSYQMGGGASGWSDWLELIASGPLGTAAYRDVGESASDVMEVGAFGLGSTKRIDTALNITDQTDTGFSYFTPDSGGPNARNYCLTMNTGRSNPGDYFNLYTHQANTDGDIKFRKTSGNDVGPEFTLISSGNLKQDLGQDSNFPMSQAAVSTAIAAATSNVRTGWQEELKPTFYQNFAFNAEGLDPRIDFSRPGESTYIENGVLKTAGVDEPVFEGGAWRLEPQATNEFTNSDDVHGLNRRGGFNNWVRADFVPSGGVVAPDGSNVGESIRFDSSSASRVRLFSVEGGATYTFSVWVKVNKNSLEQENGAGILFSTGKDGSLVTLRALRGDIYESLTYSWQRFSATLAIPDDGTVNQMEVGLSNRQVTNNPDYILDVWGLQFEKSHALGSYIPTHGSPATRAADNAVIQGQAFHRMWNRGSGAIIWDGVLDIAPEPSHNKYAWAMVHSGANDPRIGLAVRQGTNELCLVNNVLNQEFPVIATGHTPGKRYKVAIGWEGTEMVVFVNGVKMAELEVIHNMDFLKMVWNSATSSLNDGASRHREFAMLTHKPSDNFLGGITL